MKRATAACRAAQGECLEVGREQLWGDPRGVRCVFAKGETYHPYLSDGDVVEILDHAPANSYKVVILAGEHKGMTVNVFRECVTPVEEPKEKPGDEVHP